MKETEQTHTRFLLPSSSLSSLSSSTELSASSDPSLTNSLTALASSAFSSSSSSSSENSSSLHITPLLHTCLESSSSSSSLPFSTPHSHSLPLRRRRFSLMISLLYLRLVPLLSPTPPDTLVLPEPPSSATENPIVMPYIEDVLPRLDREVERSSSQSVQIQSHSKPLHSHTL